MEFSKTKDLKKQNPTVKSQFIPILVAISLCLKDSEATLSAAIILDGGFQSFWNYYWKYLLGWVQDTERAVTAMAFQGQLPMSKQMVSCFLSLKNLPCRK